MSEQNDRSRGLIKELYQLSEAGAFDNVDASTAETAVDFLMTLMNPAVDYDTAKDKRILMNDISRKLPKDKKVTAKAFFRYADFKRILRK
jgi:hypothetical protein